MGKDDQNKELSFIKYIAAGKGYDSKIINRIIKKKLNYNYSHKQRNKCANDHSNPEPQNVFFASIEYRQAVHSTKQNYGSVI